VKPDCFFMGVSLGSGPSQEYQVSCHGCVVLKDESSSGI
jgi:hypothetical protein